MQTHVEEQVGADSAEFTFEGACPLCEGDLRIKLTAETARSFCLRCHWISKPTVELQKNGVRLVHGVEHVA